MNPALANLARWALRRAQERSTWAGLAMLAAALGHATLSAQVAHVGDAVLLILGTGLMSATTNPRLAPAPEADPLPDAADGQAVERGADAAPDDEAGGAGSIA